MFLPSPRGASMAYRNISVFPCCFGAEGSAGVSISFGSSLWLGNGGLWWPAACPGGTVTAAAGCASCRYCRIRGSSLFEAQSSSGLLWHTHKNHFRLHISACLISHQRCLETTIDLSALGRRDWCFHLQNFSVHFCTSADDKAGHHFSKLWYPNFTRWTAVLDHDWKKMAGLRHVLWVDGCVLLDAGWDHHAMWEGVYWPGVFRIWAFVVAFFPMYYFSASRQHPGKQLCWKNLNLP